MTRGRRPIPETPEGYRARDKAVFKLGQRLDWEPYTNVGEFLHQADMEGC